jgi:hypothetical protein
MKILLSCATMKMSSAADGSGNQFAFVHLTMPTLSALLGSVLLVGLLWLGEGADTGNGELYSAKRLLAVQSGQLARTRRSAKAVPQLECDVSMCIGLGVNGCFCDTYIPDTVICRNVGIAEMKEPIWVCEDTHMPAEFQFAAAVVECEGYDSPDDPYILEGSCSVQYALRRRPIPSTSPPTPTPTTQNLLPEPRVPPASGIVLAVLVVAGLGCGLICYLFPSDTCCASDDSIHTPIGLTPTTTQPIELRKTEPPSAPPFSAPTPPGPPPTAPPPPYDLPAYRIEDLQTNSDCDTKHHVRERARSKSQSAPSARSVAPQSTGRSGANTARQHDRLQVEREVDAVRLAQQTKRALELEHDQAERDRLEQLDRDRFQLQRLEYDRLERLERDRMEQLDRDRLHRQRLERDRLERLERDRLERLQRQTAEQELALGAAAANLARAAQPSLPPIVIVHAAPAAAASSPTPAASHPDPTPPANPPPAPSASNNASASSSQSSTAPSSLSGATRTATVVARNRRR